MGAIDWTSKKSTPQHNFFQSIVSNPLILMSCVSRRIAANFWFVYRRKRILFQFLSLSSLLAQSFLLCGFHRRKVDFLICHMHTTNMTCLLLPAYEVERCQQLAVHLPWRIPFFDNLAERKTIFELKNIPLNIHF